MNNESMRKAFEEWYLKDKIRTVHDLELHEWEERTYQYLPVEMAFLAYQAAHEQRQEIIFELRALIMQMIEDSEEMRKIHNGLDEIVIVAREALEQGDGNE